MMKMTSDIRRYRETARPAFLAVVLAFCVPHIAAAENIRSYSIQQQGQDIHNRIEQGIASGLITPDEADELSRREGNIRNRAAGFQRDGVLTSQERDQLRRDLDALRADVERKLRNTQMAGTPDGYMPEIAGRETQIGKRIDYGISTGLITRTEAQRLRQRETDIYRREADFRVDGRITQSERDTLQRDLDALNRDVDRLLNNGRQRR